MGYLLSLLVGGALLTAMVWRPAPPRPFTGIASAEVPAEVAGFASRGDYEMPPEVKQALASADIVARTYADGGPPVPAGASSAQAQGPYDFVLIGGTDRTALHDPRSCLVGAGWRLEDDHTERLPGTPVEIRSCHAIDKTGQGGYDILYLYVVDGKLIDRVTQIRAAMLWSALIGKRNTPVYFLRFMQPLAQDPAEAAAAHARLQRLAAGMWLALKPKLVRHA